MNEDLLNNAELDDDNEIVGNALDALSDIERDVHPAENFCGIDEIDSRDCNIDTLTCVREGN